ncbi:MAG: PAS domain-containing protein [Thermodesulfobacteriota bacterium]
MNQPSIAELSKKVQALEEENERLRHLSRASEELAETFRVIFKKIPAPIYLKDAEGKYLLVNSRYENLADVKLEQIKGKSDFDIFPQAVAELFRSQDEEVIRTNSPLEFEETVALVGGEYTFITLKFPVNGLDGKVNAVGGFCTDITKRVKFEQEKECLIRDLHLALDEIKVLSGLLPICSSCKSIRDDTGYWNELEIYLSRHSEARLTHSLCPSCVEKLYGKEEWYQNTLCTDETG